MEVKLMRNMYRGIILGMGLSLLAGCNNNMMPQSVGNMFPSVQQNNDVAITDAVTQALMDKKSATEKRRLFPAKRYKTLKQFTFPLSSHDEPWPPPAVSKGDECA